MHSLCMNSTLHKLYVCLQAKRQTWLQIQNGERLPVKERKWKWEVPIKRNE